MLEKMSITSFTYIVSNKTRQIVGLYFLFTRNLKNTFSLGVGGK